MSMTRKSLEQAELARRENAIIAMRPQLDQEGARVKRLKLNDKVEVWRNGQRVQAIVSAAPRFYDGDGWRFWVTGGRGALGPKDLVL